MAKKFIVFALMCILFPAIVFANPNTVPCLGDLTWGESSYSVLQKYRSVRAPVIYDRNNTVCEISLDNPYIYDIRVMPTATMLFIDDKFYSISFTFSMYENDTEYNRIKKILTEKFGEPSKTEIINGRYEYTVWNKDIFSVTLTKTSISFVHNELSIRAQEARDEMQGKNITDWSSYVK